MDCATSGNDMFISVALSSSLAVTGVRSCKEVWDGFLNGSARPFTSGRLKGMTCGILWRRGLVTTLNPIDPLFFTRTYRSFDNFFLKKQSKRKANEAFKDRSTASVAPWVLELRSQFSKDWLTLWFMVWINRSEIKTASESRLIYVKESDLNRLEYSVRSFSLGVLSIYFHIYSSRCNSLKLFSRDGE